MVCVVNVGIFTALQKIFLYKGVYGMKNDYKIGKNIVTIYLKQIKTGKIFSTVIDREDFEKVSLHTWHLHWSRGIKDYYVSTTIQLGNKEDGSQLSKTMFLHKYIMGVEDGGRKVQVDHIDFNPRNNRKSNLAVVTNLENSRKRQGARKGSLSGERNVSFYNGKWLVQFQVNGKPKIFKRFNENELEEAIKYAREKRLEIYGL